MSFIAVQDISIPQEVVLIPSDFSVNIRLFQDQVHRRGAPACRQAGRSQRDVSFVI
jgi:hypothetical protein